MANLRRRYTIIDHEDSNTVEVGRGSWYVLQPAKNPADLAALYTIAENVEPELATQIRDLIAQIEAEPSRTLGTYGEECLQYVRHPSVLPFAQARLQAKEKQQQ